MFALLHFYIAKEVLGRSNSLLVLGSVFPDMRVVLGEDSPIYSLHEEPLKFFQFIKKEYPELLDFGIGVRHHCPNDRGVDYYCDDEKIGYAIQKAKEIQEEAGKLINVGGYDSLVFAHNLVEAALDLKLQEYKKEIVPEYQKYLEEIENNVVNACISKYFQIDSAEVDKMLTELKKFFTRDPLPTSLSLAKIFPKPAEDRYGVEIKDLKPIAELIDKCKLSIADSYIDYYENTINSIKKDIDILIG